MDRSLASDAWLGSLRAAVARNRRWGGAIETRVGRAGRRPLSEDAGARGKTGRETVAIAGGSSSRRVRPSGAVRRLRRPRATSTPSSSCTPPTGGATTSTGPAAPSSTEFRATRRRAGVAPPVGPGGARHGGGRDLRLASGLHRLRVPPGVRPGVLRMQAGMVIADHAVRAAAEEGCTEFNMLRGSEHYKRALGGERLWLPPRWCAGTPPPHWRYARGPAGRALGDACRRPSASGCAACSGTADADPALLVVARLGAEDDPLDLRRGTRRRGASPCGSPRRRGRRHRAPCAAR